jgi:hypothetical protein
MFDYSGRMVGVQLTSVHTCEQGQVMMAVAKGSPAETKKTQVLLQRCAENTVA